jgi:hypothetical protein
MDRNVSGPYSGQLPRGNYVRVDVMKTEPMTLGIRENATEEVIQTCRSALFAEQLVREWDCHFEQSKTRRGR